MFVEITGEKLVCLFCLPILNRVIYKTCFKISANTIFIDNFIKNSISSFQNKTTIARGLSCFHKMIVAKCKTCELESKYLRNKTIENKAKYKKKNIFAIRVIKKKGINFIQIQN